MNKKNYSKLEYNVPIIILFFFLNLYFALSVKTQPSVGDKIIDYPQSKKLDSIIISLSIPDPRVEKNNEIWKDQKLLEEYQERFYKKATEMLAKSMIPEDPEFQTYFFMKLGTNYGEKKDFEKSIKYLEHAKVNAKLLNRQDSRKYLASIESYLLPVFNESKKYNEALVLSKKVIDEYQGVGTGLFKNLISVSAVSEFVYSAEKLELSINDIENYLIKISEKYDNDVACVADVKLYSLAIKENNQKKADNIKTRILTRYPKTPEYTKIYKSLIENK